MNNPKLHLENAIRLVSGKTPITPETAERLLSFCLIIREKFRELIPSGDLRRLESRSVLGSLFINSALNLLYPNARLVSDIGSGLGIPGIPVALLNPDTRFTLLESNPTKASCIEQIVHLLSVQNITVITGDARETIPGHRADVIIGRRVAPLVSFLGACAVHNPTMGCIYLCGSRTAKLVSGVDRLIQLEDLAGGQRLPIRGECLAVVQTDSLRNFDNIEKWSRDRCNYLSLSSTKTRYNQSSHLAC